MQLLGVMSDSQVHEKELVWKFLYYTCFDFVVVGIPGEMNTFVL